MLKSAAFGVLLPALAAGVVLVIAMVPWDEKPPAAGWGAAIGAGLGLLLALLAANRWQFPDFPPNEATNWLAYLIPLALVVGLLELLEVPDAMRWLHRAALLGTVVFGAFQTMFEHHWENYALVMWPLALIALGLEVWGAVDYSAQKSPSPVTPLYLTVLAGGSSLALMLTGSAKLGQLCGAVAAVTFAVWLVYLWRPQAGGLRGLLAPVLTALFTLWLTGYFFSDLPALDAALLAVSPLLFVVGTAGPLGDLKGYRRALVQIGIAALPVAFALYRIVPENLPGLLEQL